MILIFLLLLPLIAAIWVMTTHNREFVLYKAVIASLAQLILSLVVLFLFKNTGKPEMEIMLPWMPKLNVNFYLAMDGISLLMVILISILVPVIIWSSRNLKSSNLNIFYGLIFLSQMSLTGTFIVRDGLMFYIFWELALIPVYFIIAIWGGENRIRITFKFFIYTLSGSLLMLVALIFLYFQTPAPHSFRFDQLYIVAINCRVQLWIFAAFFVAFAVKIPIFPFHTWQPDTYTIAPAAGSMLLAGIMLKMGIYGIIRFILPICPLALNVLGLPVIILSIVGLLYASIIAIRQDDLKRFVAYVSIAHVGLISAGAFIAGISTLQGAVLQMFSHGINVVGLFIIINIIEEKTGTRKISQLGGLIRQMPRLAIFFMIILLGSIGLPLTNGFIGEFLLLLGIFTFQPWLALAAGLTIIFGAVYMLKIYQNTVLGEQNIFIPEGIADVDVKDMIVLVPFCLLILWIGIFPGPFLHLTQPAIEQMMNTLQILPT